MLLWTDKGNIYGYRTRGWQTLGQRQIKWGGRKVGNF